DREPEDGRCRRRGDGDGDGEHEREVGAARLVLQLQHRERLPRCEGVHDRACGQNHRGTEHSPDGRADHFTCRVKGAVRMWPPTSTWRKSRHVPATGTSTPTVSLPGVAERPVTRVAPRKLVQPLAPGSQTWVWK